MGERKKNFKSMLLWLEMVMPAPCIWRIPERSYWLKYRKSAQAAFIEKLEKSILLGHSMNPQTGLNARVAVGPAVQTSLNSNIV